MELHSDAFSESFIEQYIPGFRYVAKRHSTDMMSADPRRSDAR